MEADSAGEGSRRSWAFPSAFAWLMLVDVTVRDRLAACARRWDVVVDESLETESSVVAFGRRDREHVVLKISKQSSDEWNGGEVLEALDGRGVVRVREHVPGAVLLERLSPGAPLSELSLRGQDADATEILADVIGRMSPTRAPRCPTVWDWAMGFDRYLASGDEQLPKQVVEHARHVYRGLSSTQTRVRLLHGDLQHYNVLFDSARGWLAIDPKGVLGELEYELGAALRNPVERPDVFATAAAIERRIDAFASSLQVDATRVLAWAFSQAVLSAIWAIEDASSIGFDHPAMQLANAAGPLLRNTVWR